MIKKILTVIYAAAFIITAGCAPKDVTPLKSDTPDIVTQMDVVKLKIKPYSVKVTSGYIAKFQVEGIDSTGNPIIISAAWKLTGDKADIGTLDNAAGNEVTFAAGNPGIVTLEADYNKLKASAEIEVLRKMK